MYLDKYYIFVHTFNVLDSWTRNDSPPDSDSVVLIQRLRSGVPV